jgi:lipoprotein-anchoring transpeptidase ErfK/SrfK
MVRVCGSTSLVNGRFWCVAVLTAAGVTGITSRANATLYYMQDSDSAYYRPIPFPQPHRQKIRQHSSKKVTLEQEAAGKPQGPLIIAVSIARQQVKVYDANGFFAQSPVSSGMAGHATPMGVFSVIQKHKLHHSNIYSNAPMPYMQRITWSGVALHAGVLPGYPASHGCIRMPTNFAIRMWNWTRMGARVIVTPGELSPASFSHPFLPSLKVAPPPVVADMPMPDAPIAAKADKGAPTTENIELRSSVGHSEGNNLTPVTLREQTRTADAAAKSAITMSDASAVSSAPTREDGKTASSDKAASTTIVDVVKTEAAKPDDAKPLTADDQPATADRLLDARPRQAETAPAVDTPKADDTSSDPAKDASKGPSKALAPVPAKGTGDAATAAPDADAKKDQSRMAKPDTPKRTGQIAVFISRKDSKIYVRQNFAPLFEAPVTIAASDRPLGTHIFTAEVDRNDSNVLHWSVVSVPSTARSVTRIAENEHGRGRQKTTVVAEAKPLPLADTAAEALDRINVAANVMTRISEALTTGGSIIVSDQGINQGETGEGTDFIVSLR